MKTNVIQFPIPLPADLLSIERRALDLARERGLSIDSDRLRRALKRLQPLHDALSDINVEIPDTNEDRAALQRLEQPLKNAIVDLRQKALLAQLVADIDGHGTRAQGN